MSENIYCGIGPVPKNKRRGKMTECAEKRQIRYYGIMKVDPRTLTNLKRTDILPETREKLLLQLVKFRGLRNRNKGRYEGAKDERAKEEYYKEWQKAEKEISRITKQLKKSEVKPKKKGDRSAWINHVKEYASEHGVSYKEAMSKAGKTYQAKK